jgi:Flp pilus assembly protein TadG
MYEFNRFRIFRGREDGSATIEFVILFPAFISLFLMGFESGFYMVRNVMLERAVDLAARDVRISNGSMPDLDGLKQVICSETVMITDCLTSLQIELEPIDKVPGSVAAATSGGVRCIDKDAPPDVDQTGAYNVGFQNQLMLMRVCALSKPIFPTTGIGLGMKIDTHGNYAIVATTAFVNEPGNRNVVASSPSGNGGSTGGSITGGTN